MKKRFCIPLLAIASVIAPSIAQEAVAPKPEIPPSVLAPEMRRQFDGLFNAWREAMIKKDFNGWQKTTAVSRQMETQNRIVSQMMRYPDVLFNVPLVAPDLSDLFHVAVLVRGDTATSVYFGKADFGVSDPSEVADNFVVLRYVREYSIWKFDNLRVVKFGDDSDVLLQIRNRDYQFLEGPEFQPPGVAPPVPRPVKIPEFVGEVRIRSIGHRATIGINGQHQTAIANNDVQDLIIGGLKEGGNQIHVTTERVQTDSKAPEILEIAIYAADAPDQPARRVYHFRTNPGDPIPSEFTTKFGVQKASK